MLRTGSSRDKYGDLGQFLEIGIERHEVFTEFNDRSR
jgi:hypothetical protein